MYRHNNIHWCEACGEVQVECEGDWCDSCNKSFYEALNSAEKYKLKSKIRQFLYHLLSSRRFWNIVFTPIVLNPIFYEFPLETHLVVISIFGSLLMSKVYEIIKYKI